jgi:hypothetical protein
MSWEETFKSWGAPPGKTEKEKMENAETAIRKAIKANAKLSDMDISIILQGSYRSRTNVRNDSDVDICVCLNSTFFRRYPPSKTQTDYYHTDGSITFREFKNLVHTALGDHFGYDNITPGNKAFDIHSNTYRVDADVVPAFAYRYYHGDGWNDYHDPTGIAFDTDDGKRIINWPHHTYENCKAKQECTGERYRKMTRILKRLRNKLQNEKNAAAKDIPSFLIQSMVWSAPDDCFNRDTYTADVRAVLAHCFNETLEKGSHATLKEVNDMKYIFGEHQPCTREKAHAFFSAAWDHIGFK